MAATSALFSERARADLDLARAILRHDLSDHALGESMFLAQQCVEKQLKAIILKLNEAMGFQVGDGFLFELSHKFYPKLRDIRSRFVKSLPLPPAPVLRMMGSSTAGQAFSLNERIIGSMGDFWKGYVAADPPFHMYVWMNSMHVRLTAGQLDGLNEFFHKDAMKLSSVLGGPDVSGLSKKQFTNSFPPMCPMRSVIMDAKRTENVYSDYAWSPHNQEIQKFKDTHLARQDRMFSDAALRHVGSLPKGEQKLVIRRLVAEFAFEAASSQAYRYIVLFPHNTLGRYPKNLPDGSSTTEIYESRPTSCCTASTTRPGSTLRCCANIPQSWTICAGFAASTAIGRALAWRGESSSRLHLLDERLRVKHGEGAIKHARMPLFPPVRHLVHDRAKAALRGRPVLPRHPKPPQAHGKVPGLVVKLAAPVKERDGRGSRICEVQVNVRQPHWRRAGVLYARDDPLHRLAPPCGAGPGELAPVGRRGAHGAARNLGGIRVKLYGPRNVKTAIVLRRGERLRGCGSPWRAY